mgnify:FL=1
MITLKGTITKAVVAFGLTFPQAVLSDEFTAADVLEWPTASQDSYFDTSIGMIAIVATQTGAHGHVADCLNNWYWTKEGNDPEKNALIREVMGNLSGYDPQAVILAVVEKHCGTCKPD